MAAKTTRTGKRKPFAEAIRDPINPRPKMYFPLKKKPATPKDTEGQKKKKKKKPGPEEDLTGTGKKKAASSGGSSSGGYSGGSSGGGSTSETAEARRNLINLLRRLHRRQNPPMGKVTNQLIAFAVKHKMSQTEFLELYRSRDPNYEKTWEYRVRRRDVLAGIRNDAGTDVKIPAKFIDKLVKSDASSAEIQSKMREQQWYKDLFPGLRFDQSAAQWREATASANTIANQYLGRDLDKRELAMLHSRALTDDEFESNLNLIGSTADAARWAARGYTANERERIAFSQKFAAELKARGAAAKAMQQSFVGGQGLAAGQFARKKNDESMIQPLI